MRMDKITVAADQLAVRQAGNYRNYVRSCIMVLYESLPQIRWNDVFGEVDAHVVGGMWSVKCPLHEQQSVIFADERDPFFCPLCLMATNNGRPMRVRFPDDRARIEQILLRRPQPKNRNWIPGETLAELIIDNVKHGVDAPHVLDAALKGGA